MLLSLLLLLSADGAGGPYVPPTPTLPSENPEPVFGWPIWSDGTQRITPVFSGGSWLPTLPLTNLQDRRLSRLARSTNAELASTKFDVDLQVRRNVGLLALAKHNLSTSAMVRWRGSNIVGDFSSPVYDSGWVNGWPIFASEADMDGINVNHVQIPDTVQNAQFWRCEIDDTSNPAGYVDIGRAIVAGRWEPSTGIAIGAKLGLESATERIESDGGAALYREKPIRRAWDFTVPTIEEIEAFGTVQRMLRQLGASGQLFFVFDKRDPFMHERAFLAVMRELSAIEYPYADAQSVPIRLLEEL